MRCEVLVPFEILGKYIILHINDTLTYPCLVFSLWIKAHSLSHIFHNLLYFQFSKGIMGKI